MPDTAVWTVGGRRLEVKNLDKVFFPEAGLTKGDVLAYYRRVAGVMLPYLENRPLTLYMCPDGLQGACYYRRKLPSHAPEWFPRVYYNPRTKSGRVPLILVDHEAELLWLANQAAIEFHLWAARWPELSRADLLIFDLDPGEVGFEAVLEAALLVRERLRALGLEAFPKTSGGRGLHLFVPLKPHHTHDEVRAWAKAFAERLAEETQLIGLPRGKSHAGDRVQIDYAQNGYGRNTAAPYTLRAKPGAPVSTPLTWAEVEKGGFTPRDFNLKTVPRRLGALGDVFSGLREVRFSLP
jgi:bifunctional non-homologous end joining protein LigD